MRLTDWFEVKSTDDSSKQDKDGKPVKRRNSLYLLGAIIALTLLFQLIFSPVLHQEYLAYLLLSFLLGYGYAQHTIETYQKNIRSNQLHYYKDLQKKHYFSLHTLHVLILPVIYKLSEELLKLPIPNIDDYIFHPLVFFVVIPTIFTHEYFVYRWVLRYEQEHQVELAYCNDYLKQKQLRSIV